MMTKRIRVSVNVNDIHEGTCERWWQAAVGAGDSAPGELKRLLAGAEMIEVTEQEGQEIRKWAEGIDGWSDANENAKPLLFQSTEQVGIL